MAETSRSQVTITLGGSGQVVKRAGPVLERSYSDPQPAVGSKRSVRDRLGSNVDTIHSDNKRQRGDSNKFSMKAANVGDDIHLAKDDLRFKIMKRTQSVGEQNGVDLRELLSRSRSSTTTPSTHQRIPERRNERQRMPGPRNDRQLMPEPRDIRQDMPEPRDSRNRMPEPRDDRQRMPESRDPWQWMPEKRDVRQPKPEPLEVRWRVPDPNDVRQRGPDPANGSVPDRIHSTISAEALPQMGLLRNSYSPWTLDHIRRRSPDRVLDTSRRRSPPRNAEEPQRRAIDRTYDDFRTASYVNRDGQELSRPMTSASLMTKSALPPGPAKSCLVASARPPAGIVQRSRFTVDELPTLDGFLYSLGLEKYKIHFQAEEVDMALLSQMGESDLKEMGIPMGPRKKILLALLARSKRRVR